MQLSVYLTRDDSDSCHSCSLENQSNSRTFKYLITLCHDSQESQLTVSYCNYVERRAMTLTVIINDQKTDLLLLKLGELLQQQDVRYLSPSYYYSQLPQLLKYLSNELQSRKCHLGSKIKREKGDPHCPSTRAEVGSGTGLGQRSLILLSSTLGNNRLRHFSLKWEDMLVEVST